MKKKRKKGLLELFGVLVVFLLITLAVFGRGTTVKHNMVALLIWCMYVTTVYLDVIKQKFTKRSALEQNYDQMQGWLSKSQSAIIRLINSQVTTLLQSEFPDAAWNWCGNKQDIPLELAYHAGSARIATENTGDYAMADVVYDELGMLSINMIQSVGLKVLHEGKPKTSKVQDWYKVIGKDEIWEAMKEMVSKGHKELVITEKGLLNPAQLKDAVKIKKFPSSEHWEELMKILKQDEISAFIDDAGFHIKIYHVVEEPESKSA